MEIDVNNGAFQVVMESVDLNVVVGDSARIDVGEAINYIKSGEAEIEAAVEAGKNNFNANATAKTNAFNQNATDKTAAFNNNATTKTGDFNANAANKTNTFNQNATDKTTAFNNNATSKTNDFNDNYTAKKALIDAQVSVAEGAAALSKQWAIGDPTEPAGNSAKYWADQASSLVSGLAVRVSTIEGEIPSDASSSNQLADKAWVGNQGYITGITSGDVTTALGYTPYDASNPNGYTSNVGTVTSVNNTSPDGNGNVTITIPDPLPSQTGQSGKFLTTDGTDASWANVDALPSQTGQSGKYLTTDGTDASWATISIPSVDIDGKSITRNSSNQLQTIGVINQNDTTTALKVWSGDEADLPTTKDANTFYATEETVSVSLLDVLYPVGSIYITTNAACPLSTLIAGSTWVQETSRILVDKGCNGTDWWELYSDGWCRQGGVTPEYSALGDKGNINLLKQMADNNYSILISNYHTMSGDYYRDQFITVYGKTTTTFGVYVNWAGSTNGSTNIIGYWQAEGYTSTTTTHKRFRRTA